MIPGKSGHFYIYTHVREDALDLYGFASRAEKELYLTLLSVTGIGPKGALGILSRGEWGDIIDCIVRGDKEALTQMPGIGKKTAERVVLEIADTLRKKLEAGAFGKTQSARTSTGTAISQTMGNTTSGSNSANSDSAILRDAKAALIGLGYREQDIAQKLQRVMSESEVTRAEELIRTALRQLNVEVIKSHGTGITDH